MSVIGIDFGNESCYIAIARSGGIDTITNDYSLRATPSVVAFGPKSRILGVAAKNQMVTNMKNTIYNFKRLIGKSYTDNSVQAELKSVPYSVGSPEASRVEIMVLCQGKERVFSPEQITAMLLTKLKETAEISLKVVVKDCVISVPSYFTDVERKALLDAASIANLNVLRLFNDPTATALAYGIYKQDLPSAEEKPRNVIFVDCGHTSLQVAACAFYKGKLKILATSWDADLGGRDFDQILASYFADDFQTRYNIDARSNPRAWLRLTTEVEKVKKQMSANSTKLPLNIECFIDDKDVHGEIQRSDMDNMCTALYDRAEVTMQRCLEESKLRTEDIHAVEIVGGSSRIPAIKQLIEKVFHKIASTTLNQDEAVARGCALQCAMLSPTIRVREFSVIDVVNYPIQLNWDTFPPECGEMEVFSKNHMVPCTKMLSFYRKEAFALVASYCGGQQHQQAEIGKYMVKGIKPDANSESQKIKLKVILDINGMFSLASASLMEKQKPGDDQNDGAEVMECEQDRKPEVEEVPKGKRKKRRHNKAIELSIESQCVGYSAQDISLLCEEETQLIQADIQEKERIDARNALEECVYDLRNKLSSEDELSSYVSDSEREFLWQELDTTETWLYEDEGENCSKDVYFEYVAKLKAHCEPVKFRSTEFDIRETALLELNTTIMVGRKLIEQFHNGDERYKRLAVQDIESLEGSVTKAQMWFDDARMALASLSLTDNPPVSSSKIRDEKQALETLIYSVVHKQKSNIEVPSHPETEASASNTPDGNTDSQMDIE